MDLRSLREGRRDVELAGEGHRALWDRRELQGQLDDRGERAECAAPEAREVVTGDVLHDPATRFHRRAVTEHDASADHPVPRVEVAQARGPTGRARERPAHGRAVVHPRLDRPALLAWAEGICKLRERGAGAHGRHEIVRLVLDDPAEARKIEGAVIARRRIPDAEARAAARYDDGFAPVVRAADGLDDLALALDAHHVARLDSVDGVARDGNG